MPVERQLISPLYLADISPISPLHLAYISTISPQRLRDAVQPQEPCRLEKALLVAPFEVLLGDAADLGLPEEERLAEVELAPA